jgi:hypothetical protein
MAANVGLAGIPMRSMTVCTPCMAQKSYVCCSEMKPAEMLAPKASNYH